MSCFGSSLGRRDSLVGNLHHVANSKRTGKTTNTTPEFTVHVQADESGRLANDGWKDLSLVTAMRPHFPFLDIVRARNVDARRCRSFNGHPRLLYEMGTNTCKGFATCPCR